MADHRITDFVDQAAIDRLKELNGEMQKIKDTYVDLAQSLLQGLKIKVQGVDDLDRSLQSLSDLQQRAATATERLSRNMAEQGRIAANTTNTISRQLMEQEKLNEMTRKGYDRQREVKEILTQAVSSYGDMVKRMAEITVEQEKLNKRKADEKKLYEKDLITKEQYTASLQNIIKKQQALSAEKAQLEGYTRSEAKESANAANSYNAMSQELARLKKAYRELDEEGRNTEIGQKMLAEIKELGAHLKDMDASMGDFQRNVGDYAIACNNGVVVAEDLNRVLEIESGTIAGCIEQNKELEKAKLNLNTADADYAATLDRINAKIEENKRRITDVDGILNKEAASVAEAESQNKQLAEALKLIDFTAEGAAQRIAQINAKIQQNKQAIEAATPALRDETKAMEEQKKASAGLVDQLASLVGVNSRFGSSLASLGQASEGGSVFEGLGVKVKAFGQTLKGVLANPWVLTFLGIAGTAAAVKWWYDFNKGLIEATRLVSDFTGKAGDDLKSFRNEVSAVADHFGKDFKSVLNAADKMASQLGITYDEALENIKKGFEANADAQGNFLSQIERYAPALRDAGLSASEMVAVISQTRSGLFGEDGLKAIQTASDRIKRMPKATADALDAIGMSHKEIQKALTEGTMTMMDVIQQASAKMSELPENSKEVGEAMYNLFGRKAAAGGMLMVESLKDLNTSLDAEREKTNGLAEAHDVLLSKEKELKDTMTALFEADGFEKMTLQAKALLTEGLNKIVKACVDIVNWFLDMYNKSKGMRWAINGIGNAFMAMWEAGKFVINQLIDSFSALGDVVEGVLTLNVDKITAGYKKGMNALKANVTEMVKNIYANTTDAINRTVSDSVQLLKYELEPGESESPAGHDRRSGAYSETLTDEEKKALEKAAKEQLKVLNDLDEAVVKAMAEGHEKEMELIRVKFRKKISEIKGEGEEELKLRVALIEEMNHELAECERKYQENRSKIDLSNRLASVKKHSAEEQAIKEEQLEEAYRLEMAEAEKTGADTYLIERKYEQLRKQMREEYAGYRMKELQDRYAGEQAIADNAYNRQMAELHKQMNAELAAVGDNEREREKIRAKYEDRKAQLTECYAQQTLQSEIDLLGEMLKEEDLSAQERERLITELAKMEIALEQAKADAAEAADERKLASAKRTTKERMELAQKWLETASQGLTEIAALSSAIADARIAKIEEAMEAMEKETEEAESLGEKEQERVSELVEKKVISEEEGEARKRAAAAKTAEKKAQIERRQQELEKQKQQLQYRQAVWDKGNQLAQTGIATATAIMRAWSDAGPFAAPALTAIIAALGALQTATILATPIPKYKQGTDYHKGGLAIVGDGGRAEVVYARGEYYVTPDTPTLVSIPQGAKVYPDAERFAQESASFTPIVIGAGSRETASVSVDFTRLERKIEGSNELLKAIAYQQKGQGKAIANAMYLNDFNRFKAEKGL